MKAATKKPKTKAVGHKVAKKPTGCMVPVGKMNGKTLYQRKAKPKTQGKK